MLTSIKILAAAIFIVTGGAVFSEKYRKHGVLAILASIVSVMSAYYLIRSIKDDIVNEVETVAITSNKRADDFLSCENSYLIVTKQDPQCNFGLSDKSELMYNDQITEGSLTVIYENSGLKSARKIPSNMYVVYPQSPSGRYAFIQSCQFEENGIDYGLCWAPFIFDKKSRKIHETSAGKYGPERWINWSLMTDMQSFQTKMKERCGFMQLMQLMARHIHSLQILPTQLGWFSCNQDL